MLDNIRLSGYFYGVGKLFLMPKIVMKGCVQMYKVGNNFLTAVSIALFLFPIASSVSGQAGNLPPIDESQFSDTASQGGSGQGSNSGDNGGEIQGVPTAVIEGVQISGEPGERSDEKVISCYFIFRDKPSSYFYEVKVKEKTIIFEFNDTKTSSAPIPSAAEPPIKGFTVDERMIDVNKDIKGLKPEYHNQIKVTFNLSAVPDIHVNDEYNVISYSYRWSTDSTKLDKYIIKPGKKWPYFVAGGAALIGGGVAAYLGTRPPAPPEPIGPIPITDLPSHHQ